MARCRGQRAGPGPTLPLTPRVALGTSSLRPSGLGCSSMGHIVLGAVVLELRNPLLLAQGPSFQGPSAPSLSGCSRSGLPGPHSQSVSSPRNSSTVMSTPLHGPRSGAAERLAMLFLPGGLLPQTGRAHQQKAQGCILLLFTARATFSPQGSLLRRFGLHLRDMALNLHREEGQDAWLHVTARPRRVVDGLPAPRT